MQSDDTVQIDQLAAEVLSSNQEDLKNLATELVASFREGNLFIEPKDVPLAVRLSSSPYVVYHEGKLYLERAWKLVQQIEKELIGLESSTPELFVNTRAIDGPLLPEQKAAIEYGVQHTVSLISGGPGTGKTFTAGWLVKLFIEQHPDAKVILTAPTGKACSNLALSIQRACGISLTSKTLHSLLSIRRLGADPRRYTPSKLGYDLFIVDESSMIDAALFLKLLQQIKPGARVVFLGDPNQLEPVEPGAPFSWLVNRHKANPGMLTVTKRQEEGSILLLAEQVLNGQADVVIKILKNAPGLGFFSLDNTKELQEIYSQHAHMPSSVEGCFQAMNSRRLLCPLREGKISIESLNAEMLKKNTAYLPIMICQNDYHLNLTNGQIGILHQGVAYFEDLAMPNTLRKIPEPVLPQFEPAFCLSVHKSQGSEYDEVTLLLPERSERFGRKMLYTAITRARKRFVLFASVETIRLALS